MSVVERLFERRVRLLEVYEQGEIAVVKGLGQGYEPKYLVDF